MYEGGGILFCKYCEHSVDYVLVDTVSTVSSVDYVPVDTVSTVLTMFLWIL